MARRFADCVNEAIKAGHITPDEGRDALRWYNDIRAVGGDDTQAKQEVMANLQLEILDRERKARMAAEKIVANQTEVMAYRTVLGAQDVMQGIEAGLQRRGHEGRYVGLDPASNLGRDLTEQADAIYTLMAAQLDSFAREFRKGVITGDARRSAKWLGYVVPGVARMQARLDQWSDAMRGAAVSDPLVQEMVKAVQAVNEAVRQRFNAAGGHIGKLENWGGPQTHNADALKAVGQQAWVDFMLADGMLERERMVNPATNRKLSDGDLIESLKYAWESITTGGHHDDDRITAVPTGRGSLANRHADHRFLHFTPEGWRRYADRFGMTRDPYAAQMIWLRTMARDIAAMEKYGPNPNATFQYLLNWADNLSRRQQPTEIIIREARERLADLQTRMMIPAAEFQAASARFDAVTAAMEAVRAKYAPQLGGKPSRRNKAKLEAFQKELQELTETLLPYWNQDKATTEVDPVIAQEMRTIVETMREEIVFAATTDPVGYFEARKDRLQQIWAYTTGTSNVPVSRTAADVMAGVRSWITATTLAFAPISAISDANTIANRLAFRGVSRMNAAGNPFGALGLVLKHMATLDRAEAQRMAMHVDAILPAYHAMGRDALLSSKFKAWNGFLAERVLDVGGLQRWTEMGKILVERELTARAASYLDRSYADLPAPFRDMLATSGFDAAGWDKVRQATPTVDRGSIERLTGADIARWERALPRAMDEPVTTPLAERWIGMLARETGYAVIQGMDVKTRSAILAGTRPGTLAGEALRSALLFKSFPIQVLMMNWGQGLALARGGDRAGSMSYMASYLIGGMLLGMLALALKDVGQGRDPRRWLDEKTYLDPKLMGAALLQAGGLGIYGDFLFSDVNRFGGSLGSTIAGPVVDRLDTLRKLTIGNAQQALQGKPMHLERELVRFLRQNTPGVWQTQLLVNRMVFDQLQRLVDPEAPRAFQTEINKRKRDYGQEYFWRPGDPAPHRSPDVSRPFATRN